MTYFPRLAWGARPRRGSPGRLDRRTVEGVALHWPALASPVRGVPAVTAALRSWQRLHMDTNGWSDIAYQFAVDQDGHRYRLRGHRARSAANGSTAVNSRFGAVLLILAPDEIPSPKMVRAVKRVIRTHRRRYPCSTQIVGHGQIRPEPTACPGPIAQRYITEGRFTP